MPRARFAPFRGLYLGADEEIKMKTLSICIVLLFAATLTQAQEHAPTKAQCDADLNLWRAGLMTGTRGEWTLRNDAKISFIDLLNETQEMGTCEAAYMPGDKLGSGPYAELAKILDSIIETRLIAFLKRHPDLMKQFIQEDAAALR
jgi:hypothetical protein